MPSVRPCHREYFHTQTHDQPRHRPPRRDKVFENNVRNAEFPKRTFPDSKTCFLVVLRPFWSVWKENQISLSQFSLFMPPHPSTFRSKVAQIPECWKIAEIPPNSRNLGVQNREFPVWSSGERAHGLPSPATTPPG